MEKAKPFRVYHYFGFKLVDCQQRAIGIIDYQMTRNGYCEPQYLLNLGSLTAPAWTVVSRDHYHRHIRAI